MTLLLPKKITILGSDLTITYNKLHDGGFFDLGKSNIEIGIMSIRTDPKYTLSVISHELMEIILAKMGARYYNGREEVPLFSYNHQTFENSIQLHTELILNFIKI